MSPTRNAGCGNLCERHFSIAVRASRQIVQENPLNSPILFMHIPKTGGTSLINYVSGLFGRTEVLDGAGDLSINLLERRSADIAGVALIHGHCGAGVIPYLRERCQPRILTVLRQPSEHAVSIFRHICVENPLVRDMGFTAFLLSYKYYIVFQSASICVALASKPIKGVGDVVGNIGAAIKILDTAYFVSTLDQISKSTVALTNFLGRPCIDPLPELNRAKDRSDLGDDRQGQLLGEYEDLRTHPEVADLIALEEFIFARAKAQRQRLEADLLFRTITVGANELSDADPRVVHRSSLGAIRLIGNWEGAPEPGVWWTGNADTSTLTVYIGEASPIEMIMDVVVEHFAARPEFRLNGVVVQASEFTSNAGQRSYGLQMAKVADDSSSVIVSIVLPRAPRDIPPVRPYIPSLALGGFRLAVL